MRRTPLDRKVCECDYAMLADNGVCRNCRGVWLLTNEQFEDLVVAMARIVMPDRHRDETSASKRQAMHRVRGRKRMRANSSLMTG